MNLYTTAGTFIPKAAKSGSKSAAKTPLTLIARKPVTKTILNDKDAADYIAATDDKVRTEVLSRKSVNSNVLDGLRVSISTAALADFKVRVLASLPPLADDATADARNEHARNASATAAAIWRSGSILLISGAEVDDTDDIAASLFETV